MSVSCVRDRVPGQLVVALRGALDSVTAPSVRKALARHIHDPDCRRLLLDLAEVEFLDCSGLRTLLTAQDTAAAAGISLHVAVAHPAVELVLDVTGTRSLLMPSEPVPAGP